MNKLQTVLTTAAAQVINNFRLSVGLLAEVTPEDIERSVRDYFDCRNKVNLIKEIRTMSSGAAISERIVYDRFMVPPLRAELEAAVRACITTSTLGLKEAKDMADWLVENWDH